MAPSFPLVGITTYLVTMVAHCFHSSSAPPTTSIQIAIWILPEELTPEWKKQPLGDQIVTDVASLLQAGSTWQCKSNFDILNSINNGILGNVSGYTVELATISISCEESDVLVSSML